MFTTIVAWIVFVATSLVPVLLIVDTIVNQDLNERRQRMAAARGLVYQTSWTKVGVIAALWFASGYYLFG